jgi:PPK2 family polyphosphate:nucleotide phosphotransferase
MHIPVDRFRVAPGRKPRLAERPTEVAPFYRSKDHYKALLEEHVEALGKLQSMQYAHDRYALLTIFQGMDASGKDGAIKHVMSGLDPQGCQVATFKQPSALELDHDFLWRAAVRLPERGRIGIFNRSYYEEVLVVRVHPELLRAQKLPGELVGKDIWEARYRSIREFEAHLYRNGTRILKFYFHLSNEEQRKRFLARIDEPDKNWKLGPADVAERRYWNRYRDAYERCLAATSTADAPWYVVPADDKQNARLIVSQVILDALKSLGVRYPGVSDERRRELKRIRKQLER